jgi:uncharacterized membrane protein
MRMKVPVFWICVAGLLAVVVHLSYVLFSPSLAMENKLDRAVAKTGVNAMAVLSPAEARTLTGLPPAGSIYAACPYNLRHGDLTIVARFPSRPWTISVYGRSGTRIFSVNDKQAGVDDVSLAIKQGSDIFDMLTDNATAPEIGDGWSVEVKERRGLVLLWMADSDPAIGDKLRAELAQSKCTIAPRVESAGG